MVIKQDKDEVNWQQQGWRLQNSTHLLWVHAFLDQTDSLQMCFLTSVNSTWSSIIDSKGKKKKKDALCSVVGLSCFPSSISWLTILTWSKESIKVIHGIYGKHLLYSEDKFCTMWKCKHMHMRCAPSNQIWLLQKIFRLCKWFCHLIYQMQFLQ